MSPLDWTYEEKLCYIAHIWADKEKEMSSLQDFDYSDMAKAAVEFINSQRHDIEFKEHIDNCFKTLNEECEAESHE